MLPFLLTIGLFAYYCVIGLGLLHALRLRRNLLQGMLLAPAAGVSALVLCIFWLSRVGLPVKSFAWIVGAALLAAGIGVIARSRIPVPLWAYIPFAAIFLVAAAITGRPMFEYGWDWLSYGNDDMANYVLASDRFVHHGYFHRLSQEELLENRDLTAYYWRMFVEDGARPASELLLAWVTVITKRTGHEIFMPVILSLHLVLLSAAAALAYQHRRLRTTALTASALLALSAMNTMGTILQLIAQVFGVGLMAGCATVLMRPRALATWPDRILCGLLIAALMIAYPEIVPFLGFAAVLYYVYSFKKAAWPEFAKSALLTAAVAGIALNTYVPAFVHYLNKQAEIGSAKGTFTGTSASLFPHFFLPSGLAQLWGFYSISVLPPEPWLSLSIAVGLVMFLLSVMAIAWQSRAGQPAAFLCIAMLFALVILAGRGADYGVFKLVMFCQPFLLTTLVRAWFRRNGEGFDEQEP